MTTTARAVRRGTTLLELVVVIAILGVMAAVVAQPGLSARRGPFTLRSAIDSLRRTAVRAGRCQHAFLRDSTRIVEITALPTGDVLTDSVSPTRIGAAEAAP